MEFMLDGMRGCPVCGREQSDDARFCPSCGSSLAYPTPSEERKVVSVVFADLVGSTGAADGADPEDVRARLSDFYTRLREELERYGGTVEKFIGDAVMAVFGAPVVHEDDAERAVRAALAVRDLPFDIRVGVNTGEALVVLHAAPGEAMVAGDVVNTASRLQAAAEQNTVLVGESTYYATRDRIDYRTHAPIAAKGKAQPVQAWQAVEAHSDSGVDVQQADAPLVGRTNELDGLMRTVARVRDTHETQLVTIAGEAGIGKSRLVRELKRRVDGGRWLQGRCVPYGDGIAYWSVAEMVKAQAGILHTDDEETMERKLHAAVAALANDMQGLEEHLRPLVGLRSDVELTRDSFPAWQRFFEALAQRQPLILVFEDLHWADDQALDFVDHLADQARGVPITIVCTARTEFLEVRPAWGTGRLNTTTLVLPPLSDAETSELIAPLARLMLMPPESQRILLERAEGNPLYAEQFVRMFAEGRGAAELPESVQGVIAARVDALPADAKILLQAAATVGKVFWAGAAAAVVEREPQDAQYLLRALERKDFVRRERRSSVEGETQYAFRHALLQDVAYAQLPRALRAHYHIRAAQWLESLGGRGDDVAAMRAHHYASAVELAGAAGVVPEDLRASAREAVLDVARRARGQWAHSRAGRWFRAAQALSSPGDAERPRIDFEAARGEWFSENRDETSICARIEQAERAMEAMGDVVCASEALATLATYRRQQPDFDAAAALRRATRMLSEHDALAVWGRADERAVSSALEAIGLAYYWSGRWDDLVDLAHDALLRDGSRYHESFVRNGLARMALARGELEAALDESELSVAAAQALGDGRAIHPSLGVRALVTATTGNHALAHAILDEIIEREGGHRPQVLWFLPDVAFALVELGRAADFDAAWGQIDLPFLWVRTARAIANGDFPSAAATYRLMGSVPDQAWSWLEAAKRGDRSGLEAARAFFVSVGARRYLAEADALLPASA